MSLTTPEKIETLQSKLYAKAKAEPGFRFYRLYDKVYRADILAHAYAQAKANKGASGVDGVGFETIEAQGLGEWLARLGEEVRHFLRRRHKVRSRGTRQFSTERIYDDRKVLKLGRAPKRAGTPHAFA